MYSEIPPAVAKDIWRYRDARGRYVRLDEEKAESLPSEVDVLMDDGLRAIIEGTADAEVICERFVQAYGDARAARCSEPQGSSPADWFAELVEALPFKIALKYPFARPAHINILEANVRLSLVKHLARDPGNYIMRHICGQDSRVCLGASAKGRSSSRRLNHILRKGASYCLGADISVGGFWTDTRRMPADGPTRNSDVPVPGPARSWVASFLSGDLTALDTRLAQLQ